MGQSGISMLNKVGHSMFWNSMWDNKIMYNRLLKEDLFLNKFFSLAFNDGLSANILNYKKKNLSLFKRYSHIIDNKKIVLYKYLKNINKVNYFSSKLWILRYQKWVVLYHFVYITNFNKKVKHIKRVESKRIYGNNFFYIYKCYAKINKKLKISYNLHKNQPKINFF